MERLILLDWDSTIADEENQINDSQLQEAIQAKIDQGWYIGLNSDTPLERLRSWWKSLQMNGPIIAEKGAVLWWPDAQDIVLSQTSSTFSAFRQKIILALTQRKGYALFFGDNTQFIRSANKILCNDTMIVALDAYRVCSVGMFVRRIIDGMLVCDLSATESIYELLKSLSPPHPLVSQIDLNPNYGFLSVNALDTDKTYGVRVLLEKWAKCNEVIMIGDSMADYLLLPDVRHWAVGNAQHSFKVLAEKIASKNYAQGCVELLSTI